MYSLDEEKIDVHIATEIYGFWHGKKVKNVFFFGIRDIYLSLTLSAAKFKQLDYSCSFLTIYF